MRADFDRSDPDVLSFEDFRLDIGRAELSRAGLPIVLRPKSLALLVYFVRRPGRVLSKSELLADLWPGVVVTDDSLSQCVGEVRAALRERGPVLVKTLPRLGYRFDAQVEAIPDVGRDSIPADVKAASIPEPASRWGHLPRQRIFVLGSAVLVAGLLVGAGAYRHSNAVHIDAAMLGKRSMAVIPFVDLSVPPAPHLAEGITQEIVTDIGRLPDALVIVGGPRADRPASPAVDVRLVGRELDVRHVLTGSVRREGDRITAHVQMTRTDTGAVLWSERFEYARVDGAIRDIAQHVAGSLEIKLGQAANDSARDGVGSGEAMDLWMRGDYLMRHLSTHAELLEARRHLEAALILDPQSLHAMSALAGTYVNEVIFRWSPDRRGALAKARSLAERALAIDPDHAVALSALGNADLFDSNFDAARALFDKALRVNPNSPSANRNMAALLYYTAQFEELKPYIATALRLGPSDGRNVGRARSILGFALMVQGRHEEAYAELRRSVVAEPSLTGARYGLVAAAALTGRKEEAHRLAAEALRSRPDLTIAGMKRAGGSRDPAFSAAHQIYMKGLSMAGIPDGDPQVSALPVPQKP